MDFKEKFPFPFYLDYPWYMQKEKEEELIKDFDYLQETYPAKIRKYINIVSQIIDKFDYKGSMIYDEYPDKLSIMKMTEDIYSILMKKITDENNLDEKTKTSSYFDDKIASEDLKNLVSVLLCNEIYKRRHKCSGIIYF